MGPDGPGRRAPFLTSLFRSGRPTYPGRVRVHEAVSVLLFCAMIAAACLGPVRCRRLARRVADLSGRATAGWRARHPAQPKPIGRPFEVVAWHAQRLGYDFHTLPSGTSFSRYEGRRQAYDAVLTEACQALGVDHLIGILTPGPDLDRERSRVELVLGMHGLRIDDAAA